MRIRRLIVPISLITLAASAALAAAAPAATDASKPKPVQPGTARNFTLIGHDPLMDRGMNAAPALYEDEATGKTFVYVGSRTDGSHANAGVLVVDVSDPTHPAVVNQIGPPNEALPSQTSRELRVWPQQKVLLVMNFQCSAALHACASNADVTGSEQYDISFYDLSDPANPVLVSKYVPSRVPHEMFLWVDPRVPLRALLYMSTPTTAIDRPNMIVTDISGWRDGSFKELTSWEGNRYFPPAWMDRYDVREHSMDVSPNGRRVYVAYLGGGLLVLDSSQLADGAGTKLRLISKPQASPRWRNMTVHTAEKVPGRPYLLTTDEIYGDILDPLEQPRNDFGCPWGWVHMLSVRRAPKPKLIGQYQTYESRRAYCKTADGQDPQNTETTSYSAHNPTIAGRIAFVSWHSDGLQAIDLRHAAHPRQAGFFEPDPEVAVETEDPMLSSGRSKVVVWSYPIIHDGLIYVIDIRNGLYVLRYTGPGHRAVDNMSFLEGNSNLGDALRLGN